MHVMRHQMQYFFSSCCSWVNYSLTQTLRQVEVMVSSGIFYIILLLFYSVFFLFHKQFLSLAYKAYLSFAGPTILFFQENAGSILLCCSFSLYNYVYFFFLHFVFLITVIRNNFFRSFTSLLQILPTVLKWFALCYNVCNATYLCFRTEGRC